MSEIRVEQVRAELTRRLRQTVLRPGRPVEDSIYPSDSHPQAQHFAAWAENNSKNKIVGVASVFPENFGDEENAWRSRGMAVDPDFQGKGVGRMVLQTCIDFIKQFDARILWCNGRATAWGFYRQIGFEKSGESFHVPESGEHFVMILRIKN